MSKYKVSVEEEPEDSELFFTVLKVLAIVCLLPLAILYYLIKWIVEKVRENREVKDSAPSKSIVKAKDKDDSCSSSFSSVAYAKIMWKKSRFCHKMKILIPLEIILPGILVLFCILCEFGDLCTTIIGIVLYIPLVVSIYMFSIQRKKIYAYYMKKYKDSPNECKKVIEESIESML